MDDLSILFVVSVTVNICMVVFLVFRQVSLALAGIILKHRRQDDNAVKVIESGDRQNVEEDSRTLAMILTNQVSTWVFIVTAIYILVQTSVLSSPFTMSSDFAGTSLVITAMSANIGRYVFKLGQLIFSRKTSAKSSVPAGVSHVATLACYVSVIIWRENHLIGVVGLLMESGSSVFAICRCMKMLKVSEYEKCYLVILGIGALESLVCRVLLPCVFISYGISRQSPMDMSAWGLAVFCGSICFFGIVAIWYCIFRCGTFKVQLKERKLQAGFRASGLEENNAKTGRFPQVVVEASLIQGLPSVQHYQEENEKCPLPTTDLCCLDAHKLMQNEMHTSSNLNMIKNNLQLPDSNTESPKTQNTVPSKRAPHSTNPDAKATPVTNKNLDVHGKVKKLSSKNLKKMRLVGQPLEAIPEAQDEQQKTP